jgi:hypothetical protein
MTTAPTASQYRHLVTVVRVVPGLGNVEQAFRTTDDAVEFHRANLVTQIARGNAVSFTIAPIAA